MLKTDETTVLRYVARLGPANCALIASQCGFDIVRTYLVLWRLRRKRLARHVEHGLYAATRAGDALVETVDRGDHEPLLKGISGCQRPNG